MATMILKDCIRDLMKVLHNSEPSRKIDSGINFRANSVSDYYKGYPFVSRWEYGTNRNYESIAEAQIWCDENCKGKYTNHIHRVIFDQWNGGWIFNNIGGLDYCFWAFENEEDAVMFSLKW